MGPPRFWLGPVRTMTPLHCDYDDNVFAQIWGTKRIFLAPPHHDEYLYPKEANAILFGSPFDPEAPDYERYPLARQATTIECMVNSGDSRDHQHVRQSDRQSERPDFDLLGQQRAPAERFAGCTRPVDSETE